MGTKTFNIDDSLYENFTKYHKGDMSKIVSELIENYLSIKTENLELTNLKQKLVDVQNQITKLKQEESNLRVFVRQLEEEYVKEIEKAKETDIKIVQWARDIISDAKKFGTYTELKLESEKEGYSSVEEYLIYKWEREQ
jgi:predicted CopG family antitoxin